MDQVRACRLTVRMSVREHAGHVGVKGFLLLPARGESDESKATPDERSGGGGGDSKNRIHVIHNGNLTQCQPMASIFLKPISILFNLSKPLISKAKPYRTQ